MREIKWRKPSLHEGRNCLLKGEFVAYNTPKGQAIAHCDISRSSYHPGIELTYKMILEDPLIDLVSHKYTRGRFPSRDIICMGNVFIDKGSNESEAIESCKEILSDFGVRETLERPIGGASFQEKIYSEHLSYICEWYVEEILGEEIDKFLYIDKSTKSVKYSTLLGDYEQEEKLFMIIFDKQEREIYFDIYNT